MINLLPHPVTVSGVTLEPIGIPLEWTPIVVNNPPSPFPALAGFTAREGTQVLEAGADVLVPRFAAAVTWALKRGYTPHCLPLDPRGRQQDGSFVCTELEPAPEGLAVSFVDDVLDLNETDASARVVRCIGGNFVIQVFDGPDLPSVAIERTAYRRPDGTVHVPELDDAPDNDDGVALIVPQDGLIIDAVAEAFPAAAILVPDVARPGQRTRLFQVR